MKYLLKNTIFSLLLLSSFALNANETQAIIQIENLLLITGPQDFVSYVQQVQAKAEVNMANPFAPRAELSSESSYYWTYFQGSEYLNELKKQIFSSFTSNEIDEIYKFYKNPFHAKYLIHFNTRARLSGLHNRIGKENIEDLKIIADKMVLTKNLLTTHLLQPIIEKEKELLQKEIDRINQIYSVVKLSNNVTTERELKNYTRYLENYNELILKYYTNSFEEFRKSGMRYMVNAMKDRALIQKFASIIITYHYFYLLKYQDIFKNKENLKKKLEEKENYRF